MAGAEESDELLGLLDEILATRAQPTELKMLTKHKADPKYDLGPFTNEFAKELAFHQLNSMCRYFMGRRKTEEVEAALLDLAFGTVEVSNSEARLALALHLLDGHYVTEDVLATYPEWRTRALIALVELFQVEARNSDSKRNSFAPGKSPRQTSGDVALFAGNGGERSAKAGKVKGGGFLKAKLSQHLKSRPTLEDLQDRNILASASAGGGGAGKPARHTIIPDMPPAGRVLAWEDLPFTEAEDSAECAPSATSAAQPQLVTTSIACAEKGKDLRYLVEPGGHYDSIPCATTDLTIEDTVKDEQYFQKHFASKEHVTYTGLDAALGPVVISIQTDENAGQRLLIRTEREDTRYRFITTCRTKDMLKALKQWNPLFGSLKLTKCKDPTLPKQLVTLDQQSRSNAYKFGILYFKEGQSEDEMFGNSGSTELYEFLDALADKVVLEGWNKFRGGLDVKQNSTGTHSYYTAHMGSEIMFHVSTLLPHSETDFQQLERKRHLGNDVVVVVFKEGNQKFSGAMLRSEFNHQFAVVQKVEPAPDGSTRYRVEFACKETVPRPCKPLLPDPPVFKKSELRDWFLTKLINAERVALNAPHFADKLTRTRRTLLTNLVQSQAK